MIVIFNVGSSSFKWKIFDSKLNELEEGTSDQIFPRLEKMNPDFIGHRFVHGSSNYRDVTKVNQKVIFDLEKLVELAPLHNEPALETIKKSLRCSPLAPNYLVFDTQFFTKLPNFAKIYPIPYKFFEEGVYRFGFHGISHEFAFEQGCKELNLDPVNSKVITIHLGAGCSMAAIKDKKAIDTSMGFTPNEGLVMATRAGDFDVGIIDYLHKEYHLSLAQIEDLICNKSGWYGLTGEKEFIKILTNLHDGTKEQKARALLALEIIAYRIKKYIGAYTAALGGLDALIFTGKIGFAKEAKTLRQMALSNLEFLGHFKVLEIEPNEELAIAKKILQPSNS